MSKILSYLTSLALIGAVYSTSVVENTTYETLVLVVVWALIFLGGTMGAVFTVVLVLLTYNLKEIPPEIAEKWNHIDKPNWWLSLPLLIGWLWALSVAGWTVTAVAYLLETSLLLTVSYLMYVKLRQYVEDKEDPIQFVKDPAVRKTLHKAIKERNS